MIDVGITTDEIDRVVHEACIEKECYPSPLNYYKYPKSCCTSINEVICHGIPDMRALINGDICNGLRNNFKNKIFPNNIIYMYYISQLMLLYVTEDIMVI